MNKRLFVGGIPFSASKDEITTLFSGVGKVASVDIISDKFTGQPKGFGFVEMETEEEAKAAIEKLNGYEMGDRKLAVAEAKPKEPRRFESRGFGGRGGFGDRREGGRGSFGRDGRGGGGRRRGGFSGRGAR